MAILVVMHPFHRGALVKTLLQDLLHRSELLRRFSEVSRLLVFFATLVCTPGKYIRELWHSH